MWFWINYILTVQLTLINPSLISEARPCYRTECLDSKRKIYILLMICCLWCTRRPYFVFVYFNRNLTDRQEAAIEWRLIVDNSSCFSIYTFHIQNMKYFSAFTDALALMGLGTGLLKISVIWSWCIHINMLEMWFSSSKRPDNWHLSQETGVSVDVGCCHIWRPET